MSTALIPEPIAQLQRQLDQIRSTQPLGRALTFAFLISLLSGVFFGLAPAIHTSRSDLSLGVREGARGSGYSTKTSRIRDALIVSEMAFAVVLMVRAGSLLRTLRELLLENPGFNPVNVVTANIWLPVPNDPRLDPYLKHCSANPL